MSRMDGKTLGFFGPTVLVFPMLTMKYWHEILAVTERILTELIRRKRNLIFWTVFPISILLLTGYILAERTQLSLGKAMEQGAASTLVGAALFFSCLGGSLATIVAEREQQTLKRLFMSPLSGSAYFLGIFAAHSFIGFLQIAAVYWVSSLFGARFQGSLYLGLIIIILSISIYVSIGFILGTQLAKRTEDVNTLVATFGVPLLMLGGAFIPTAFFPKKLLDLAEFNPIYHMNQCLVGVWDRGENLAQLDYHFWFLFWLSPLTIVVGWLAYKRMIMIEQRL